MTETAPPRIVFRPVAEADFPMLWRWLAEPHVRLFFQKTPISLAEVAAKFAPRLRGEVPTRCHVALHDGTPFGYLQSYRNANWPEWAEMIGRDGGASIDLHIGDPAFLRRGLGRAMLAAYVRDFVFPHFADLSDVYVAHEITNAAAVAASIAEGFRVVGSFVEAGLPMRLLVVQRGDVMGATSALQASLRPLS